MTKSIEERVATLESENKNQETEIKQMSGDIKEIKDTLLKRPSWAVTIVITILSTLCASLIVGILI
jgi:wobble nucleotide-excising tRNase